MADYWDMMATQEAGLDDADLNTWNGEAFNLDGAGLTTFGKGLLSQDQFYEMNGMTGMTSAPATSGLTTEGMMSAQNQDFQSDSFLGKTFAPIKDAMTTTDTFLRSIMGDKTLGIVYGSAIMAGAQGIMSYLVGDKTTENYAKLQQDKFVQEDKVRQETYAREDEARARTGSTGSQAKVVANPQATAKYKSPGLATSKRYDDYIIGNKTGLLGS